MGDINWFPGHMHSARKELKKILTRVDVALEIIDARAPRASSNPLIFDLCVLTKKPILKVLNKVDLADPKITKLWIEHFKRTDATEPLTSGRQKKKDVTKILNGCRKTAGSKGYSDRPLQIMIVGTPNVGKSTIFNLLACRRISAVADEPAVTRKQRVIELRNGKVKLIDTPGLLWPKIADRKTGFCLAVNNGIGKNAVFEEAVAEFLGDILLRHYPKSISNRYQLTDDVTDGAQLIQSIVTAKNLYRKGRISNTERAAHILLNDYRAGRLGRISLEHFIS